MKKLILFQLLNFFIFNCISQEPCIGYNFPMKVQLDLYNQRIYEFNSNKDTDTLKLSNKKIIALELMDCGKNLIINEYDNQFRITLKAKYNIEKDTIVKMKVLNDPTEINPVPYYIEVKYAITKKLTHGNTLIH